MKHHIFRLTAALAAAALVLSLSACAPAPRQEEQEFIPITFVLDWTPNTNHTGLYVAQAQGLFEQAGLKVDIVQPPQDGAEVLVGSGKAQFGVSFQDYLAPALAGDAPLPITAVAALIQHNTSGILSRAGEGMDRPAGLEGKNYATWDLPVEKATLAHVMAADGGSFDRVTLIPSTVTDEVSALRSRSVDAIWVYYAWAGIACEVAGLDTDYFAFGDIDPVFDYYTPVVIANDAFLAREPDAARAFLAALGQGYAFAAQNPDQAAQILMDAAPELRSNEALVLESQRYLAQRYTDDAPCWGWFDRDRWSAFFSWLTENGLLEGRLDPAAGFTNDFLPCHE